MIKEDYVSFEIAKLLKEKGFDWECFRFYTPSGNGIWKYEHYHDFDISDRIDCPTLQMAMKWLREKYTIHIEVEVYYCEDGQMWLAKIQRIESANTILVKTCMVNNTYEEAVESAINYCLKN